MTGEMTAKGNFKTLRMLDQYISVLMGFLILNSYKIIIYMR